MVETFDGTLHKCVRDAIHHLHKLEAAKMSEIGHNLNHKKFTEVQDYVDKNLALFLSLAEVRRDLTPPTHNEESRP